MADSKISDLTALTTPATGDLIPIVDISEAAAADKNKSITVGELLRGAPDGTAAAPGIAFESDGGNGMFLGGTDILAFSTGGSQAVTIDASQRLLVGTSSAPTNGDSQYAKLSVQGYTLDSTGYAPFALRSGTNAASLSNGDALGRITFASANGHDFAQITSFVDGTPGANDYPGRLVFSTTADNESSPTARMTIKSNGNVGIGVTNPGSELSIKGSGQYAVAQIDSTGATGGSTFRANQNGINTAAFGVSGWAESDTSSDALVMGYAGNGIRFYTNGVNERARIDSSGRLLVNTTSSSISGVAHFSGHAGNPTYSGLISITRGINSGSVVSGHGLGGIQFGSLDAKVSAFIGSEADAAWGTNDYPGRLVFHTTTNGGSSPTEHGRFTETGAFKASTDGTYAGTTLAYHELVQHNNNNNVWVHTHKGNSTPYGGSITFANAAPDDNTRYFLSCTDNVALRLRIYSDGDVQNHDNSYGAISDEKLKQDIVDAGSQWDDLKNLRVRKFRFISDVEAYGDEAKTLIGVVAQEVEAVSPGLVKDNPDLDADNNDLGTTTKTVNYSVLYMKAVKALQEAMERIETLEAKVAALESA